MVHFADIANQTLLDMVEVLRQDGVSQVVLPKDVATSDVIVRWRGGAL